MFLELSCFAILTRSFPLFHCLFAFLSVLVCCRVSGCRVPGVRRVGVHVLLEDGEGGKLTMCFLLASLLCFWWFPSRLLLLSLSFAVNSALESCPGREWLELVVASLSLLLF